MPVAQLASQPTAGVQSLATLFNTLDSSAARRLCHSMVVTSSDVFTFVVAGFTKQLGPYQGRICNVDHIPDDLHLTDKNKVAMEGRKTGTTTHEALQKLRSKLMAVFCEAAHVSGVSVPPSRPVALAPDLL